MRELILHSLIIVLFFPIIIISQETLSGNWGGVRENISEFGIDFEFAYSGEYFSVLNCDLENSSCYLDNIDLTATFDFEKLFAWKGATLFSYVLGNNGGIPNERVGVAGRYGTIQGITNIAAPNTWKLYQFWIEQQLYNNKLSLLFGLYDLNSEFDVQETSGIFVNPSHGIGAEYAQTGKNGPSIFPTASLVLRFKYTPTENSCFLLGLFDGVPGDPDNSNGTHIIFGENDGLLISYEMGLFENGAEVQDGFGKYSIGGWYYTSEFEDLTEVDEAGNPKLRKDNLGIYFSAEKFMFSETENPEQGIATFLRFGIANGNINNLDYYWGVGINITGLIDTRDDDVVGLAIGTAHAGAKFQNISKASGIMINKNEMILEVTYSLQVTPWFRIQPDYQYIINPMGSHLNQKSSVLGVRTELVF